jgi:hypothetical protein
MPLALPLLYCIGSGKFIFIGFQEAFYSLPYFFNDPWSCSNLFFGLQVYKYSLLFLLLLSSSFILLWSYSMQGVISIFLYLLRLALCLKIWSILEKVPWAAKKNVYCATVELNTPWLPFKTICSMVSFNSEVSLFLFLLLLLLLFGWPSYWWQSVEVSQYHCVEVCLCF